MYYIANIDTKNPFICKKNRGIHKMKPDIHKVIPGAHKIKVALLTAG